jgi:Transposase
LRHTEEQIVAILREQEAGAKTADVCSKHGISSLKKLFADAMLDNAMLKSCCQKKMATPAVKREAGDIKLLTHSGQASGRPPSWLPDACIASARKGLEAQIVSLFSPDCHDKTTKSAFLLPNGVDVSDPKRLVC